VLKWIREQVSHHPSDARISRENGGFEQCQTGNVSTLADTLWKAIWQPEDVAFQWIKRKTKAPA